VTDRFDERRDCLETTSSPALRLALTPAETAAALGVSRDFLDEHVMPELRIVRRGRRRLVPIRELERWLDREASRPLTEDHDRRLP
jgi:hypothetical protein